MCFSNEPPGFEVEIATASATIAVIVVISTVNLTDYGLFGVIVIAVFTVAYDWSSDVYLFVI